MNLYQKRQILSYTIFMKKDATTDQKEEKECCGGNSENCQCEKEMSLQALENCCGGGCCAATQK